MVETITRFTVQLSSPRSFSTHVTIAYMLNMISFQISHVIRLAEVLEVPGLNSKLPQAVGCEKEFRQQPVHT